MHPVVFATPLGLVFNQRLAGFFTNGKTSVSPRMSVISSTRKRNTSRLSPSPARWKPIDLGGELLRFFVGKAVHARLHLIRAHAAGEQRAPDILAMKCCLNPVARLLRLLGAQYRLGAHHPGAGRRYVQRERQKTEQEDINNGFDDKTEIIHLLSPEVITSVRRPS